MTFRQIHFGLQCGGLGRRQPRAWSPPRIQRLPCAPCRSAAVLRAPPPRPPHLRRPLTSRERGSLPLFREWRRFRKFPT